MRTRAFVLATAAGLMAVSLPAQSIDLNGAGATFAYPIYSKWFSDYAFATKVRINYQSIGSGGGIRQLTEQTVDFGATDAPIADADLAKLKDRRVLHIPTVVGAVVATYNLPSISKPLKLSGALLADIYLGRVTKWNDPRIASLNAGVKLPGRDILVVYRADGSGTSYVFTDFLSTVSTGWSRGPGRGMSVQWPVGLGGKGNEGVAGQVKQIVGAIGYVELTYARQNRLAFADVQNAAGTFVTATIASMTAAAATAPKSFQSGADWRVSIVNAAGKDAYPIASFTWLLVEAKPADAAKGRKMAEFLRYALTEGQKTAPALFYAPLPVSVLPQLQKLVDTLGK